MIVPGTAGQVLAIILLILPGFVFTAVRKRRQGPSPNDGDFGVRLLTAIVVGIGLDAVYVLIGGHHLIGLLEQRTEWSDRARLLVIVGVLLLLVIPAIVAILDDIRLQGRLDIPVRGGRRIPLRYTGRVDRTPTAWDFAAVPRGGTFVRVRLDNGVWTGGWVGDESFLSTWPEPRDLFIQSQWRLDAEGKFIERVPGTRGVYVSCAGAVVVEWVDPPADDTAASGHV